MIPVSLLVRGSVSGSTFDFTLIDNEGNEHTILGEYNSTALDGEFVPETETASLRAVGWQLP